MVAKCIFINFAYNFVVNGEVLQFSTTKVVFSFLTAQRTVSIFITQPISAIKYTFKK